MNLGGGVRFELFDGSIIGAIELNVLGRIANTFALDNLGQVGWVSLSAGHGVQEREVGG